MKQTPEIFSSGGAKRPGNCRDHDEQQGRVQTAFGQESPYLRPCVQTRVVKAETDSEKDAKKGSV